MSLILSDLHRKSRVSRGGVLGHTHIKKREKQAFAGELLQVNSSGNCKSSVVKH